MAYDWNAQEKALYERSRVLKMQARELRKKRLAEEAIKAEQDRQALIAAREARRVARDQKIRAALRGMETSFSANGVSYSVGGMHGDKSHAFTLHVEDWSIPVDVRFVAGVGFEWD